MIPISHRNLQAAISLLLDQGKKMF